MLLEGGKEWGGCFSVIRDPTPKLLYLSSYRNSFYEQKKKKSAILCNSPVMHLFQLSLVPQSLNCWGKNATWNCVNFQKQVFSSPMKMAPSSYLKKDIFFVLKKLKFVQAIIFSVSSHSRACWVQTNSLSLTRAELCYKKKTSLLLSYSLVYNP